MTDPTRPLIGRVRRRLLADEFARRLVHASGAGLPALYLLNLATWGQVRLFYMVGTVIVGALELLRLSVGLNSQIYDHLTRGYEENNVAGYALYMFSSTVVAVGFEPQIAIPAILMLVLGDPLSGTLSSGELRTIKRPPALVGMFCICVAVAAPFLSQTPLAVVFGALGGTLADGVKPIIRGYVIDDNLTIPPAAAAGILLGIELATLL